MIGQYITVPSAQRAGRVIHAPHGREGIITYRCDCTGNTLTIPATLAITAMAD